MSTYGVNKTYNSLCRRPSGIPINSAVILFPSQMLHCDISTILPHMLGRSLQQIKSDVGEKGDLGIVAEVRVLNTILKLFMKNAVM